MCEQVCRPLIKDLKKDISPKLENLSMVNRISYLSTMSARRSMDDTAHSYQLEQGTRNKQYNESIKEMFPGLNYSIYTSNVTPYRRSNRAIVQAKTKISAMIGFVNLASI